MPLADSSRSPTFSDVYRLLDLSPKVARLQHVAARDQLAVCQSDLRYAMANVHLDRPRVIKAQKDLDGAKQKEIEARSILVLLEDTTFRRELMTLDTLWRRFRMARSGITNDRFGDAIMGAPDEQTAQLRTTWKTICDLIASKATTTPVSALAL